MKLGQFTLETNSPLFLIAGPCVIESEDLAFETAGRLQEITQSLKMPFIYKSSFDKANRTSLHSFRGLGMEKGLAILEKIRQQLKIPVLTDVHENSPLQEIAQVVDILQTPAFLCRQTDFIQKVAQQGLPVNLKKGQFLAPWDMMKVVEKAKATGNSDLLVCERGVSFGYNRLIVDMCSLAHLRQTGCPVVFDATHSVQQPAGLGDVSGGQRACIPVLARAAVAVGIAGLFMETHPNPDQALSDGATLWPLSHIAELLETLQALDETTKRFIFLENSIH